MVRRVLFGLVLSAIAVTTIALGMADRAGAAVAAVARTPTAAVAPKDVRLVAKKASPVTVRANFGGCVEYGIVEIEAAGGGGYDYRAFGRDADGRVDASFALTNDEVRGRWNVSLRGASCDYADTVERRNVSAFTVRRDTRIPDFNATPEPVRKGGTVTVKGTLQRLNPWRNVHVAYTEIGVHLEYRAVGSASNAWKRRAVMKTNDRGEFTGRMTATENGYYRAVFPGTGAHARAVSRGDRVDVR